ncbi:hypothetical protein Tco_0697868 [Tanacetum coccineum]
MPLFVPENRRVIGKCNMRINPGMKPKEPTYQATVIKHKSFYQFKIDKKRFFMNVEAFREILNICPKVSGKAFDEPHTKEEALSFIRIWSRKDSTLNSTNPMGNVLQEESGFYVTLIWEDLAYQIDNIDSKKQDKIEPQSQGKPKENPIQNISSEESLPKKKGKGLNVLLEVALSEAAQLKEATKRSKKDLYISQASGSGDGTSFESRVPDEK